MRTAELLGQAAQRVFGHSSGIDARTLRPMSDAGDNRSWYVEHAAGRCVAKFPENKGGQAISPALEYELLQLAADAGVAPQPCGHDRETDIVFVAELTGCAVLSDAAAGASQAHGEVARTLRQLHCQRAPAALRRFDPPAFAAAYCAAVRGAAARAARALLHESERLTAQTAHLLSGTSLCHNDLHAGNILVGEQIWFIDFEYAVQAAPIVDVASYVAYNKLGPDAAVSFAQACLGADVEVSATQLQAVVRIHHILGELWEIARSDDNAKT